VIPAHLAKYEHAHPRLTALALLQYVRYLAEPRTAGYTREAYEAELERIHGSVCTAIRMLGSEPGPKGRP
jgi:hypothetical protein